MVLLRKAGLFVVLSVLAGCGAQSHTQVNPETARQELGLRGIKYTPEAFVGETRDGDEWSVRLFLAAGMRPDVHDARGDTPVFAALAGDQPKLLNLLLAAKPDLNQQNREGVTPLMYAVRETDKAAARTLLARGAD